MAGFCQQSKQWGTHIPAPSKAGPSWRYRGQHNVAGQGLISALTTVGLAGRQLVNISQCMMRFLCWISCRAAWSEQKALQLGGVRTVTVRSFTVSWTTPATPFVSSQCSTGAQGLSRPISTQRQNRRPLFFTSF